jgi:hypothetical protein
MSLQEIPYKHMDTNIFHDNTQTSIQNRRIESTLQKSLQSITKTIVNETKQQKNAHWTYIFGVLRPKLNQLVYETIRDAATQSYTIGARYAVNTIDKRLPFFITESDISNIKSISQQYSDKYWNRMQTTFMSKVIQDDPTRILNPSYVDQPVSISLATEALAEGTKQKAETILLDEYSIRRVAQAAETPKLTSSLLQGRAETISTVKGFLERQSRTLQASQNLPAMQFIWVTAADACKNLCDPIRGVTWYVGQPFPYHPPRHANCRCRLFLIRVSH